MEQPPVIGPRITQWEYKTIKLAVGGFFTAGVLDVTAFDNVLNKMGEAGWELISAFDTNHHQGASREAIAIFKKPRAL